jgi:hypothetical protein
MDAHGSTRGVTVARAPPFRDTGFRQVYLISSRLGTGANSAREAKVVTGPRAKISRLVIALTVVVAVFELTSVLAGGLPFSSVRSSGGGADASGDADSAEAVASAQLAAAESSLTSGAGPTGVGAGPCYGNTSVVGPAGCSSVAESPATAPLVTTTPSWTQLTYPVPPSRVGASMVYDAKDKYVLLFGGYGPSYPGGAPSSDTWTFKSGIWTELTPATSPPARQLASMTYDAKDGYVLLYGGLGSSKVLSDTWKFANGKWTKLSPTTNPGARYAASMAYDAKDGYVVLFGGTGASGLEPSLTWKFVGGQWTSISTTPAPGGRAYASMDYDAHDGYVLLFGGDNTSTGTVLGDTWTFSAGVWTELAPASAPPARDNSGLAYSAINSEIVLYGGEAASGASLSDTWTFAGGAWTKISTAATPGKRNEFSMADGSSSSDVLIFGGVTGTGTYLANNWTFAGIAWTHVSPRVPPPLGYASMAYDEKDGYVVLFGGYDSVSSEYLNETWKYLHGVWSQLHPSVSPPARYAAGMTYDQGDGYIVLFGGNNGIHDFADTWTFVAGSWSLVPTTTHPPARALGSMTYDYADDYVLLFGGYNDSTEAYVADTWAYSAGVWSVVRPSVSPAVRGASQMTYDSEDGYVLLFSGQQVTSALRIYCYPDTWTYSAGSWTNVTSALTASPPGTATGGLADDTYDGYPLLYGGYGGSGYTYSDSTWEFSGSGWIQLSPASNPGYDVAPSLAFDPADNVVVLSGGSNPSVGSNLGTWTY